MTVLFVIATILLFLMIDWVIRRIRGESVEPIKPSTRRNLSYPIRVPDGIFFAKSHTWLTLFPSGSVQLGVDDFVGRLLENPTVTLLKKPGDEVSKGDPIILLKENHHELTIRSPLEGTIMNSNEGLVQHPESLNERLFSDGWGYIIKPRHSNDVKGLLLGTETRTWLKDEFRRLRDLFSGVMTKDTATPAFMQDGGPPIAGVMKDMDNSIWKRFESEFLIEQ